MKYLIILLTSGFLVGTASADMSYEKLGSKIVGNSSYEHYILSTTCIDGYKWVRISHSYHEVETPMTIALQQFMIEKDGHAVPAKC